MTTTERPSTGLARGHGFGTAPVFFASISTILGAIMFLRFGYAVGHAGVGGTILIILLGHLVTIPTALAIAEIATNRRVEGGGEYFIISRSFGTTIGGTIGIALFLSQAISVAFYMIAFAEAFRPIFDALSWSFDPRFVSLPAIALLLGLMLTRGAQLGVTALYVVVATLGLSLVLFFLGGAPAGVDVTAPVRSGFRPDPMIYVFAIIFPAFTGMTAGVGLSGDLANPRRSIPLGVLSATFTGLLVYILIVIKLRRVGQSGHARGRPARHVVDRALGPDDPDRPGRGDGVVRDRVDSRGPPHASGTRPGSDHLRSDRRFPRRGRGRGERAAKRHAGHRGPRVRHRGVRQRRFRRAHHLDVLHGDVRVAVRDLVPGTLFGPSELSAELPGRSGT